VAFTISVSNRVLLKVIDPIGTTEGPQGLKAKPTSQIAQYIFTFIFKPALASKASGHQLL
jgi:hypothetical protein